MSGFRLKHRLKPKGVTPPPPVGRCIYCDSTEEPLTKEHIIPQSLGGTFTLLRASCEEHREMTRQNEQWIAREVFQDVRAAMRMKVKQPPKTIPIRKGPFRDDPIAGYVKPEDYPQHLILAVPEPPGMLEGRARHDDGKHAWLFRALGDDSQRRARRLAQGLPDEVHRGFEPWFFARFLAKIGLGMAVHHYGLGGFDPRDIRDVITGRNKHPFYLVGRTPDEFINLPPMTRADRRSRRRLHQGTVHWFDFNGRRYCWVHIQLFVDLDLPSFTVIVGELTLAGFEKSLMLNKFMRA